MRFGLLLLIISATWIASEVLLIVFRRADRASQSRDAGSVVWLNLTIYGCVGLAIGIALSGVGMIRGVGHVVPWIGLSLIVAGLAIRWVSILILWKYFTVSVAIRPDHRLVETGIYRAIRHPSYLGSIVSFVGLGAVFCNWIAFLIVVVPVTASFMKRIEIEEEALRDTFGEKYSEYCQRTKRLIPWVY